MSLYPSLEDMKVDQMVQAQAAYQPAPPQPAISAAPPAYTPMPTAASGGTLYPSLGDYMGMEITQDMTQNIQAQQSKAVAVPAPTQPAMSGMIAPLTGNSLGLQRAQVTHGIRHVTLCKDGDSKIGLRVKSISKGVFVALVTKNSPAALAGLRFGDQILQINESDVAGMSTDKVFDILKKANPGKITMAIRDRPFERTITLQKDSTGHVGFVFKDGKITALVKDSSAARNGLLTDHQLVEIEGQNVVGLKDKEVQKIMEECGRTVTITILPSFIYDHIIKSMGKSLIQKMMDHSIPDI